MVFLSKGEASMFGCLTKYPFLYIANVISGNYFNFIVFHVLMIFCITN